MPVNKSFKEPGKFDLHASVFGQAIPALSASGEYFEIRHGNGGRMTFHGISPAAAHAMVEAYNALPTCDNCGDKVETVGEDEICDECRDEWSAEQEKRFRPLYEAEKRAGILRTKEELDQELRDAGRGHLVSENYWSDFEQYKVMEEK